jgi:hypothetical protein
MVGVSLFNYFLAHYLIFLTVTCFFNLIFTMIFY